MIGGTLRLYRDNPSPESDPFPGTGLSFSGLYPLVMRPIFHCARFVPRFRPTCILSGRVVFFATRNDFPGSLSPLYAFRPFFQAGTFRRLLFFSPWQECIVIPFPRMGGDVGSWTSMISSRVVYPPLGILLGRPPFSMKGWPLSERHLGFFFPCLRDFHSLTRLAGVTPSP